LVSIFNSDALVLNSLLLKFGPALYQRIGGEEIVAEEEAEVVRAGIEVVETGQLASIARSLVIPSYTVGNLPLSKEIGKGMKRRTIKRMTLR